MTLWNRYRRRDRNPKSILCRRIRCLTGGKELKRCAPVYEVHDDGGEGGQESRYELKALG